LLAVALAVLYRLARRDVQVFARFRAIEDSALRQRVLLRWTRNAFLAFLALPLAGLALLGRFDALWRFPAEFAALAPDRPALAPVASGFFGGLLVAVIVGGTIGGLLIARRRRRSGTARSTVPHVGAMTPRNRSETLCIVLLGGNAAISEEIFFRLYLPLLLTLLGLAPLPAFAAVTLLFGLMHRYQGWLGVVLTAWLGLSFTFLYCVGVGLGWPIALHLLINLNALLLRPFVARLATPRGD
jgi:uncharacterized protein